MKKQKCPFEGVYDLFAIRIILDSQPGQGEAGMLAGLLHRNGYVPA